MLRINESADPTLSLRIRNGVESNGGFSRGLGTIDFDDPTSRQATDPQSHIQGDTPGGDDVDGQPGILPQTHHRSLPVHLLDLSKGSFERLGAVSNSHGVIPFDSPSRSFRPSSTFTLTVGIGGDKNSAHLQAVENPKMYTV